MPHGGKKKCRGCATLVRVAGWCPTCTKGRNEERWQRLDERRAKHDQEERTAKRIRSTRAWTLASRAYRAAHPWCADPYGVHGADLSPAQEVHHIVSLVVDSSFAFDESNLMSLCRACHRRMERDNEAADIA